MPRLPLICALFAYASTAAAAEPAPGWRVDRWTQADGLPINHLNELAIGPDGLLWIASFDGLVRFDGVEFEVLRPGHPEGPLSSRLLFVATDPVEQSLWVLTEEGQLQRRGPEGTQAYARLHADPPPEPGARVYWSAPLDALERSAEGEGLLRPERPARAFNTLITRLSEGQLRVGTLEGYSDGTPAVRPEAPRIRWRDEKLDVVVCRPELPCVDSGWRVEGAQVRHPDGRVLLTLDEEIRSILPQGEALWLATESDGLLRLRPDSLEQLDPGGRPGLNVTRLDGQQDDGVWALVAKVGWLPVEVPDGATVEQPGMPRFAPFLKGPHYTAGLTTSDGVDWVGNLLLYRRVDGAWEAVPEVEPRGVWGLWERSDGAVFMRAERGIWLVLDGEGSPLREASGGGLMGHDFLELADGATLIAGGAGLWRLERGSHEVTRLEVAEGLGGLRDLRLDGERLWIATEERGLCAASLAGPEPKLEGCADERSGLGRVFIHFSVADAQGRVWLGSNQGVGVVEAALLREFVEGARPDLPALWLGTDDGMKDAEVNNFIGGGWAKDGQGRLWFATQDGVVRVDPASFTLPPPPEVLLLELRVDGEVRSVPAELRLPEAPPAVQVRWTAAAPRWADQLQFRYRLGSDLGWSPPLAARSLELAAFPAGVSELEVQARLGGAWGPTTSLRIYREPALHERSIFGLLIALSLAGAVVAMLAFRSAFLQRQAERLQAQVGAQTAQLSAQTAQLSAQTAQLSAQNAQLEERNGRLAQQGEELRERSRQIAAQAERLRELDRLKRQLIANVSHELRTPLALILAPLSGLSAEAPEGSRLARDLGIALRSAQRLEQLVGQLFDLARAQAGGLQLRVRPLNLVAFIDGLVSRFRPRAEGESLRMEHTLSGAVGVWADPDLLDKVLSNLLSNALRHSPPGGCVRVSLVEGEEQARVQVEDEGPGVDAQHRERIFERFFQVDGASNRQRDGAGLGLALARELVELHGGEIGVEPGAVGARFWFTLPLGVAHVSPDDVVDEVVEAEAPEPQPALVAPQAGAPRVLLVEDHPDMRAYLAEHLSARFQVSVAANGHAALERLDEEERVELIISDVMMPGMDGFELARRVRATPELAALPLMFVSARQELADRLEGLSLADDYLCKPFRMPELLARAEALLRRAGGAPAEEAPARGGFLARLEDTADPKLADKAFRVAALARAMGMSARTLQLRMQENALPPPGEWLRERRMAVAEGLLGSGRFDSVGAVADAVGLNHSYFSRTYRAYSGRAPKQDLRARS